MVTATKGDALCEIEIEYNRKKKVKLGGRRGWGEGEEDGWDGVGWSKGGGRADQRYDRESCGAALPDDPPR